MQVKEILSNFIIEGQGIKGLMELVVEIVMEGDANFTRKIPEMLVMATEVVVFLRVVICLSCEFLGHVSVVLCPLF